MSSLVEPLHRESQDNNVLSESDDESDAVVSEEEKELYNQVHAEYDDLTSGYSTISSNRGEYTNIRRPVNSLV